MRLQKFLYIELFISLAPCTTVYFEISSYGGGGVIITRSVESEPTKILKSFLKLWKFSEIFSTKPLCDLWDVSVLEKSGTMRDWQQVFKTFISTRVRVLILYLVISV